MPNCSIHKVFAAALLCAALLVCAVEIPAQQDEYSQVIALIHMDSSISGGDNTPEMLAAVARNAGAGVGIITDHDTQKVAYGLWPLRNVLRISHSRPSIRTYGISRYLERIEDINRTTKDFILIPGIEAVPYYHWERSRDGMLSLKDLHRHLLVMGLDQPEEIDRLPSIETGFPAWYTQQSLFGLFWLVPFIAAMFVITLPRRDAHFKNRGIYAVHSSYARKIAVLILGISLIFLVDAYPFREKLVDQYGSDRKQVPYQVVIDYVNSRGGLTFWAHPEAEFKERLGSEEGSRAFTFLLKTFLGGGLNIETKPYYSLLNDTRDYTGFSIFFEGYRIVGNPGGLWDDLLMQFCAGNRARPVWAIAELELESGTSPEEASQSQTMLLVRKKNEEAYLDALRNGRMYCFTANITRNLTIRDYSVVAGATRAISGEVISYRRDARLVLDLETRGEPMNLDVVIVRDGAVFHRERIAASRRIETPLPAPEGEMGYVRVVVGRSGEMVAATNPIFLRRAGKP